MSKKRRDKEHDSSTIGKVAKVGAAALAVGVGAAVSSNIGLTRKLQTELLPALSSTKKQISKQVRDLKSERHGLDRRLQAKDIKKVYDKHLKDNKTFKAEQALRARQAIKFDVTNKKNNMVGQLVNINQVINNDLGRGLKEGFTSIRQRETIEKLALKHKDKSFVNVNNLARNAFSEIGENHTVNKDGTVVFSDIMKEKFEAFGFTPGERKDFLKEVLDSKKEIETALARSSVITPSREKIKDFYYESLKENKTRANTIFGKANKLLNKHGIDIDTEVLLKGSRPATVEDFANAYKNNPEQFNSNNLVREIKSNFGKGSKYQELNIPELLEELKDKYSLGDKIFDKSLRVDKDGNLFSTLEFDNAVKKQLDNFSSTLPGKLFAGVDIRQRGEAPILSVTKAGNTSLTAAYDTGNNSTMSIKSRIAIGNASTGNAKLYDLFIDGDGVLQFKGDTVIAEGHIRNNSHGKSARLMKEMMGSNRNPLEFDNSLVGQLLDIKQDGSPTIETTLKSFFNRKQNEDWNKSILKRNKQMFTSDLSLPEKIDNMAVEYAQRHGLTDLTEARTAVTARIVKDQKEISSMLNDLTASKQINNQTITNLLNSGHIEEEGSLRILRILDEKNYSDASELLQALSIDHDSQRAKLFNKDLENIINRGYVNTDHVSNMLNISQNKSQTVLGKQIEYTNLLDIEDIVRREAVKEIMVREASGYSKGMYGNYLPTREGMSKVERILQQSNLSGNEAKNLSYVTDWGLLQSISKIANDTDDEINLEQMVGQNGFLTYFDNLMTANGHFKNRYSNMMDDLASRHSVFDTSVIGNINQNYYNEYNTNEFVKNSVLSRLDQVNSINDLIKEVGSELTAGRHNMKDYTTLTQVPQFMAARLMWGIDAVGLGFSGKSTGSTGELIKNIALKRVAPVAGAFALYDYMNYESENITGISMTGAMANSIANMDMAARKLAYSTGLGQAADWFKGSSVIGEYWTGSTDFQTAEERAEWYENGYSAVRGGRFWGFGSTSEYRGSAIQYYQPNYLKRTHSNWSEVGVYGSAEEKFKHSWLPSLRHPLSPIRAALDPYWLEKKNMDERPYPLTGKMFSEGTPWGAILNPTVGEILKPVRMLPEVKKRLGNDGRDIRSVVEGINDRIKNRGRQNNDDMMIIRGTDIRNARYVPYANPGDGQMNISFNNGQAITPGTGYMEGLETFKNFSIATGEVKGSPDSYAIDPNGEFIQEIASTSYDAKNAVNGMIESINSGIKQLAARFGGYQANNPGAYTEPNLPDKSQGTYVYQNLVNQRNQFNSNYYKSNYDPRMIDKSLTNDYIKDATYSIKQLSGIYGFLNDFAFGEQSYSFRYENAGQMASFSRNFWDAQAGGVGGEFMEIARRFFASEDKSKININPLRNTMPEWLPERFRTGDAFASLPKGEMRMPGKGYETIHDLHPDQFGEYGAFDRFKILGDIAPTSEEYKLWRNITRNTVTDPELIKQIDEIEARAKKMSSKHEFYDYRYVNNNVKQQEGVVKSFNGSVVELVSGEQLNLGGIKLNQEADLSMFLTPGQKIHYRTSADAIKRLEDGLVTNAVIYKKDGSFGTNINKELVSYGMAERDKEDTSAIGYLANSTSAQQTLGGLQEIVAHAQIPFLHNKFMKIETARESFRQEHVYGTSFATWDNPIEGFVKPALNQTFGQSFGRHLAAVGSSALYFGLSNTNINPIGKYAAGALMAGLNPTALLGMGLEFGANLGVKAVGGGSNLLNVERGAKIGSIVGTVGWGLANAENPFKAAASFAVAGEIASKYLNVEDVFKNFGNGKGALVGAGIGLAISAIKNPGFTKEMFRKEWLPESTEKKYELDEYFDRLEYIKYQGLYKQASLRAFLFEGNVNMNKIFKRIDKNKEKIAKLTRKAEKLSNNKTAGGYEYEQKMLDINNKIQALENTQTAIRGGKYTKAAVAYKKSMESTIYGLSEGATADEILASVPVQYKDHYVAFMNERSQKERKKILKQLPEYLRKPLQISWGEKPDKIDSNVKFFKTHAMPGMAWRGWKPNINLKHVKMKTIQNEGMLLSDFGYYESEKSKMEYHMASGIEDFDKGQGAISYLSNMTAALSGLGMSVQNVSVEPTSAPGLWIAADVKQTTKDMGKIGSYAFNSGVQSLTSLLF